MKKRDIILISSLTFLGLIASILLGYYQIWQYREFCGVVRFYEQLFGIAGIGLWLFGVSASYVFFVKSSKKKHYLRNGYILLTLTTIGIIFSAINFVFFK